MEALLESVGPAESAVIPAYQAKEGEGAGHWETPTVLPPKAVTAGREAVYHL